MKLERIRFEKKEEHRGWYMVEYLPPIDSFRFATINLVVLQSVDCAKIVEAMESEARLWLARYPVPVMVSAFDEREDLIDLKPAKECNHLIAFFPRLNALASIRWELLKDEELPAEALDLDYLKKVYHDIPFRMWTNEDVLRVEREQRRTTTTAWLILFVWLVAIPLTVIVLGETSVWVARMVLAYSIWQVFVQLMKLTGRWKKSSREEERERDEREKDHHHYHCTKNPEAFLRLKNENFEKETRERVRK